MNKDRELVFGVLALLVGIIVISISYAAFTQSLNINGTGNVQATNWSVHFANLSNAVTNGTAVERTAPTIKTGRTDIGDYAVDFYTPGDSITYTFDVVNDGDYDAKISVLTKGTPTCNGTDPTSNTNVCANLEYTLKYTSGGSNVAVNDTLRKNETKNMTLVLRYKSTIGQNELPTAEVTVSNLGITLQYAQDSLAGGNPVITPSITFVNRQVPGQITAEDELLIGEEPFYVISSDSTQTVLFAKYDLKSDGNGSYVQDTTGTNTNIIKLSYSSYDYYSNATNYPYEGTGCSLSGGGSCYSVYDSNCNLYPYVNAYANKISTENNMTVAGRLLNYTEGSSLSSSILHDKNNHNYWTSVLDTSYGELITYAIGYNSAFDTTSIFNATDDNSAIRPVLVVSTSDIE